MMMGRSEKSAFTAVLVALLVGAVAIWIASSAPAHDDAEHSHADVLSLGGSVTEIIYALGEGDRLIARDSTSQYPQEALDLPDVGYLRALSPEGVLSVDPGLIISEDGAGPPEAITVLKEAQIPFVTVPELYDGAGIASKIRIVGEALGVEKKAEALARSVMTEMSDAMTAANAQPDDKRKRVLFILSAQGGRILASGSNTAASAIIELAGGKNVFSEFEGYKLVTDEAVGLAAPDVILMMDRGGDHAVANDVLFSMPAIRPTPAAVAEAVVRMNGQYILGFGPRTAQAVAELHNQLYQP